MTCKDCIHERACFTYSGGICRAHILGDKAETKCGLFKNKADFAEVKRGKWIKNKPNPEAMKEFHKMGIGKAMSEKSIFFTCLFAAFCISIVSSVEEKMLLLLICFLSAAFRFDF